LGLSRNKVAVPEGAAGSPPFWSNPKKTKADATAMLPMKNEKIVVTRKSIVKNTRLEVRVNKQPKAVLLSREHKGSHNKQPCCSNKMKLL
jgi:hypothetical protein